MAEHQNPAGRLHWLMTAYGERSGVSMSAAWAEVLGVTEADLPFKLAEVTQLVEDVRAAAEATGRSAFEGIPEHLRALAQELQPTGRGFDSGMKLPNRTAMEALGHLSAYLEEVRPDGRVPEEDELGPLREQAQRLMTDVAAVDLDAEVKRLLQHRLADVLAALNHIHIGGPEAAARAAEALATVATLAEDEGSDPTLMDRLKLFGKATWVAVQIAATATTLTLNWEKIIDEKTLGPGQEQRQIEPPRMPHIDLSPDAPNDPEPPDSGPGDGQSG